ncbi:CSS-motif domain-containing protein, partial [Salmonella enterica subsp. enterica serovar Virginia]|nr:CSS-motif domain-containing protein [Salmonella enterica subsp. enterica serovar Virginia]
ARDAAEQYQGQACTPAHQQRMLNIIRGRLYINELIYAKGQRFECCAANLFWRTGDIVFTPRLDQAGVNGIMRQFCLRQLAQSPF